MLSFTEENYTGVELDLDSVSNVLCSAGTPSGITINDARQYISMAGSTVNAAYLHICEGAAQLTDGRVDASVGKLISYLVSDFIKANNGEE